MPNLELVAKKRKKWIVPVPHGNYKLSSNLETLVKTWNMYAVHINRIPINELPR